MNVGDLIKFKSIGAGKTDSPPYSQDGEWRLGMVVEKSVDVYSSGDFDMAYVLYRGMIFKTFTENCIPHISIK